MQSLPPPQKNTNTAAPSAFTHPTQGGEAAGLVYFKQVGSLSTESNESATCSHKLIDPKLARVAKMRSSILTGQRLLTEQATKGGHRGKWAMLTLTYAPGNETQARDISDLLAHIRKYLQRRSIPTRFVWVAEMQKRGVIHYHILMWLPKGITLPKPDKQGWWPHGSTRIEWARKAAGYLAKYASKGDHSQYPKGVRIHGCGGLHGVCLNEWRWWKRPKYVRDFEPDFDVLWKRGLGGWINIETGEILQSEWFYAGMKHGKILLLFRGAQ